MSNHVLSVTQINEYIRGLMDNDAALSSVYVRGEISNYKVYPSGHHYFTLKDEGASLKCVMFRSSAMRLRFHPENGMKVIVGGKISVYPRDGAYQLYCVSMTSDGLGDLHVAFEQLKKSLAAKGLFAQEHKKAIPIYPRTIGVVTSSAGAAVHDILRVLRKRFPLSKVLLMPVRVQGVEAPGEIAAAVAYANHYRLADVLIVGRGGGSIEDLWAFNDERVAYAIYHSEIPVISAVGHEPDITISDFVADVRAATPSNAAEIVVPDQEAIRQNLDGLYAAMHMALEKQLKAARRHLLVLSASPSLQRPDTYLKQRRKDLLILRERIISVQKDITNRSRRRYMMSVGKLDAMSPLKVMTRGYAIVNGENHNIVRSVHEVSPGSQLSVKVSDGEIIAIVEKVREVKYESEQ
jgi:exodeoxyribonuclease VII large subunit